MTAELLEEATELLPNAVALRRRLHRRPELGLHLPITQEAVLESIDGLGLEISTGEQLSSITAVLRGGRPGPTVVLRGDMDALPMPEDTGLDFASTIDGAMHACGHDAHTAMLAGSAHLLAAHRADLVGNVVFMFQPGEEGQHGARYMLEEGVLEAAGSPVVGAFAIHQTPLLPRGLVATKGGPIMASADVLRVTVHGRGGHASMPHHTADPVPVACEIVGAIQTMVTRRIDIFEPAVVTVTRVVAGTTNNVVPETAYIEGTIRTLSSTTRGLVHDYLAQVVDGVASAHGLTAELTIERGFPVTVNSNDFAAWSRGAASELLGERHVIEMPSPVMVAEDFSYVLERVPGALVFLGTMPEGVSGPVPANHSNRMVIDEASMTTGIALYAQIALSKLA